MGRHERDRYAEYLESVKRELTWVPEWDSVQIPDRWRYNGWFVVRSEPLPGQVWWGTSNTLRDPQVHAYRYYYRARNLWRGHQDTLTVWRCGRTTIVSHRAKKSSGPLCPLCVRKV